MKKGKKFGAVLQEYFVVYGIIPAFAISILLLGFVFFFQWYSFKWEIRLFNQQSAIRLEEELEAQEQFLITFAGDSDLYDYLATGGNSGAVYEAFYEFNRGTDLKCVLNILDQNGEMMSSSMKLSSRYSQMRIGMIAERIRKNSPQVLKESNLLEYPSGKFSVYTMGTVVRDGDEIIGYVLIQTLEEGFQRVLKSQHMLSQVAVDRFDRIISVQNELDYDLQERFLPENINSKYYYWQTEAEDFGIMLYTTGTWNQFQRFYVMMILFSVVIIMLLIILVQNISQKVSERVTEPIYDLVAAFSYLKSGDMELIAERSEIEEFRFLAKEYNHMLEQLNQLITHNEELSEIRRVAEIKQLEAQFDPHFFLNMLETIRYISLMNPADTEKMIFSLSGILRYSLYNKEQYSSVADDMKYVMDYLFLQKTRIGGNFSYTIEIEESARNLVIPKMLIQPLIENSVKHGYQGVPGFCIEISIIQVPESETLILKVSDNGKGMSGEQAAYLFEMLEQDDSKEHIGLCNVHKRLKYMYGDGYGIQELDVSRGFCVKVRMKGERKTDGLSSDCS